MHQRIKFILFWNDTLHVSDGLSARLQERDPSREGWNCGRESVR